MYHCVCIILFINFVGKHLQADSLQDHFMLRSAHPFILSVKCCFPQETTADLQLVADRLSSQVVKRGKHFSVKQITSTLAASSSWLKARQCLHMQIFFPSVSKVKAGINMDIKSGSPFKVNMLKSRCKQH